MGEELDTKGVIMNKVKEDIIIGFSDLMYDMYEFNRKRKNFWFER